MRSLREEVEAICAEDSRYDPAAYFFMREALDYTSRAIRSEDVATPVPRHVSGVELCNGIRDYALEEFGPLALLVLNTWGLYRTSDFGELVYALIAIGKFSASESDKQSDFDNVYDFDEAFAEPYKV